MKNIHAIHLYTVLTLFFEFYHMHWTAIAGDRGSWPFAERPALLPAPVPASGSFTKGPAHTVPQKHCKSQESVYNY